MTTPVEGFIFQVQQLLSAVHPGQHADRWKHSLEALADFLGAVNPGFPRDTIRALHAADIIDRGQTFPDAEEVRILEECWNDAWDWSGSLRWSYTHPTLTLKYSPKKTGAYYEVSFHPEGSHGPMTFPLTVRFRGWADMDEEASHADECPMYNPWLVERESHSDDCPWRTVFPDATDEALDAASEACECEFECHCEPVLEHEATCTYTTDKGDFATSLAAWLADCIRGEK